MSAEMTTYEYYVGLVRYGESLRKSLRAASRLRVFYRRRVRAAIRINEKAMIKAWADFLATRPSAEGEVQ